MNIEVNVVKKGEMFGIGYLKNYLIVWVLVVLVNMFFIFFYEGVKNFFRSWGWYVLYFEG